jgi:hypothetical protein
MAELIETRHINLTPVEVNEILRTALSISARFVERRSPADTENENSVQALQQDDSPSENRETKGQESGPSRG